MSTQAQSSYISDLAVLRTKEFKEVKELLVSSGIVADNAETVNQAQTIAEITNALTDQQASDFITVLVNTKEPARSRVYSKRRIEGASAIVEDIKGTIDSWGFDGLR